MNRRSAANGGASIGPCPECGWGYPDAARRKWKVAAWRRWAPGLVVVAAFVGLIVWQSVTSKWNGYSFGVPSPIFVEPGITLEDLRRIAERQAPERTATAAPALVQGVLDAIADPDRTAPGVRALEVGLGPVSGARGDLWSAGWPCPWITRTETRSFENVFTREGFKAAVTNPAARALGRYEIPSDPLHVPITARWEWWGGSVVHRRPPEETGGVVVQTLIHLTGAAPLLGAVIGTWYLAGIVVWLLRRASIRVSGARARRVRWGAASLVGAAILFAGIVGAGDRPVRLHARWSTFKQNGFPPAPVYWTWDGFVRLGLTLEDARELRGRPDGDREMARAILAVAPEASGGPSNYLAVIVSPESQVHDAKTRTLNDTFPWLNLYKNQYIRRPDFGLAEPVVAGRGTGFFAERFDGGWGGLVGFNIASSDPRKPSYSVAVELERVGMLVVGLWGVYVTALGLSVGAVRLIARRRLARGRCPECGYVVRTDGGLSVGRGG